MSKYSEIKKEIKRLSDLQRELKPQRKLVFNGNRTSTNPIFEIQKKTNMNYVIYFRRMQY